MTVRTTNNLGVLLRSYEALHNWRALLMLAGTFILAGLVLMGGAAARPDSGGHTAAVVMEALGTLIAIVGVNASGLMLVDQAYDQPVRGFGSAFLGGMQATLYVIGALILLGLGVALVLAAVFVLSLLGRIPHVGGIFGFLLSGPSVVVVALAYAVLVLAVPLMVAAIWHGEGMIAGLSRAADIVIKKPLDVFVYFLVLLLAMFPAVTFIFTLVFGSSAIVGGMYAPGGFQDTAYGDPDVLHMFGGAMGGYGFSGPGVSIGLVIFLAWAVVSLIYLLGVIFVYRAMSEGVESEAADVLSRRMAQFKQRYDEYKSRAAIAPPAAKPGASGEPRLDESGDASGQRAEGGAGRRCPACGAAAAPEDLYCGHCGHKLD